MEKPQNSPSSSSSSDRRQTQRIFDTLVKILRSQQPEIETLAEKCKFLETYIHIQHENWSWRVQFLESHIAQLKKEGAKAGKMYQSKLDLMVTLKEEEALRHKKECELAGADLEDFRACMESLSAEFSELKAKQKSKEAGKDGRSVENSKQVEWCTTALEEEIRMLKHSCKELISKKKAKLSSEKEAEVSALLTEKDFVWNQLKVMKTDYTDKLKDKKIEVEHCNEAIEKLQHNLVELQASVNEKDEMIAKLKARHKLDTRRHTQEAQKANETIEQLQLDKEELCSMAKEKDETIDKLKSELAKLEMDVRNCNIEKSRLSKECSENDSSKSNPRKGSRKHESKSAKQGTSQNRRHVSNELSRLQASAPVHGLVRCSSKRKPVSHSPVDRPTLFHSNFKVPRLKYSTRSSVT